MRLVTYARADTVSYGLLLGVDRVLDLPEAAQRAGGFLPEGDLLPFIRAGESAVTTARGLLRRAETGELSPAVNHLAEVRLLAPIPRPAKNVFCVGRNYLDHVAEGDRVRGTATKAPEFPQFFTKPPTAVVGTGVAFRHQPAVTRRLDYEVELGVVIGVRGRDIAPDRAYEHVFGYTIINDMTARDLQRRHEQWFKGKSLDGSCPMGPCILHRSAVDDPTAFELRLTVNGEERQRDRASQMIFDIPAILASLSSGMTLEPGDVIATGTPSGVGFAMEPPRFLAAGDEVVCEISGVGRLVTPIVGSG